MWAIFLCIKTKCDITFLKHFVIALASARLRQKPKPDRDRINENKDKKKLKILQKWAKQRNTKQLDTQKSVNNNNMRVVKEHSTKPTPIYCYMRLMFVLFACSIFVSFIFFSFFSFDFHTKRYENLNNVLVFRVTNACNRVKKKRTGN